MRVCIPTREGSGREAVVHNHFGSAPGFVIVDTETGDLTAMENDNAHHAHGNCQPMAKLEGKDVDALVIGGIGVRALQLIKQAGLTVYYSGGGTVGDVVDALDQGKLPEMEITNACGGHAHGQGGGCDHGHDHGEGGCH
ncbi:MAG: diguanylate cyclase [bacterium]|nr:diguanylate cyclase [bacterium]